VNVVFDLGMVVVQWDPRHLYRKVFAAEEEMEWFLAEVCNSAWNLEQDRGRPFAEAVREATARHPGYSREIAMYDGRWAEMVPGTIEGTVEIIEELDAKGVPLFAITNWNGDKFRETRARFPVLARFRDIVVSGDEKLLKPDPEIFKLYARRNGVRLADSLFIDDSMKNVKGAEAVGMTAHHFTTPEKLRLALVELGILD
jgi:2-haloacid dehalogenase